MKKILSVLIVLALTVLCLAGCGNSKEKKYDAAVKMINDGKYDEAVTSFEKLDGYQDSSKYIMYAKCLKAGYIGQYDAAIGSLETLGDFQEAKLYAGYFKALRYEAKEEYEAARDIYAGQLLFRDVQQLYDALSEKINARDYRVAEEYRINGDYARAYDMFNALSGYLDSKEKLIQTDADWDFSYGNYPGAWQKYAQLDEKYITHSEDYARMYDTANSYYADKDYEAALHVYNELDTYKDSKDKSIQCVKNINARDYNAAAALMENGEYEKAIAAFKALGEYSDSAEQVMACRYNIAKAAYDSEDYKQAYEKFSELKGYNDVDSLLATDEKLLRAALEIKFTVDNIVTFGTYPQTKAGDDRTPIEWIVLDRKGDKALLISKFALDAKQYNSSGNSVTWETCTLRGWLNSDFYNEAFYLDEQAYIETTRVTADRNSSYGTDPGNATMDKLFLMSIPEVKKYFESEKSRICGATDYAAKNGAYRSSDTKDVYGVRACWWWLRSPGCSSRNAAGVDYGGSVEYYGIGAAFGEYGVRPCMWVRLF